MNSFENFFSISISALFPVFNRPFIYTNFIMLSYHLGLQAIFWGWGELYFDDACPIASVKSHNFMIVVSGFREESAKSNVIL